MYSLTTYKGFPNGYTFLHSNIVCRALFIWDNLVIIHYIMCLANQCSLPTSGTVEIYHEIFNYLNICGEDMLLKLSSLKKIFNTAVHYNSRKYAINKDI